MCKVLIKPDGAYNLTENLHGDARATVFRYFITRDALVKPQDELTYNNLSTIYVISPTLEKVYKEGRWEFTASSPWKMVFEKDFGEVNLYKFEKALNE